MKHLLFLALLSNWAFATTHVVAYNFGKSITSTINRIYADAPQSEQGDNGHTSELTPPQAAYVPIVELAREISVMMAVVDPNQI
jgi:hypothetical protein